METEIRNFASSLLSATLLTLGKVFLFHLKSSTGKEFFSNRMWIANFQTFSLLSLCLPKFRLHVMAAPEEKENRMRTDRKLIFEDVSLSLSLLSTKALLLPNTVSFFLSHYCQQQFLLTKLSIFTLLLPFLLPSSRLLHDFRSTSTDNFDQKCAEKLLGHKWNLSAVESSRETFANFERFRVETFSILLLCCENFRPAFSKRV